MLVCIEIKSADKTLPALFIILYIIYFTSSKLNTIVYQIVTMTRKR